VGFVDFGCIASFEPETLTGFVAILDALFSRDLERWRTAVTDIGILKAGALFTTGELYEHMRWFWAPVLEPEVTFTPDLAAEMVRRNAQTSGAGGEINRHCDIPPGMVFLTRINFGLSGLLGALGARGPWRGIIQEYTHDHAPCTPLGERAAAVCGDGWVWLATGLTSRPCYALQG